MPFRTKAYRKGYLRAWYRCARRKLIKQMGGKCHRCGYKWRLEFHHVVIRTWVANKKAQWMRIILYRRDWEAGEVVLACKKCNKKLGKPKDVNEEWVDEIGD